MTNAAFLEDRVGRPKHDPMASAFFRPTVQRSLQKLTGLDYGKVFRVARRGQKISPPTYVFMTDEELTEARRQADLRAREKWLKMPPVMSARKDERVVLECDPAIRGYDAAKYVFTDITFGVHDRARFIVVREPDGTLREAHGDERDRLNQIYFPRQGRKIIIPPLFKDPEILASVVAMGGDRYLYLLDRNCVQFEPDHPLFIRTAEAVYTAIDEKKEYHLLKSTRHYGPMMFWLVWNKACDGYIAHQLQTGHFDDAVEAVRLYGLVHVDSEVATAASDNDAESSGDGWREDQAQMLRTYISHDAQQPGKLNRMLESFLERRQHELEVRQGLLEAHGTTGNHQQQ